MKKHLQAIEAILFVAAQPLKSVEVFELIQDHFPDLKIEEALSELNALYQKEKRAFRINQVAGGYLLETIPEMANFIAPPF